MYPPPAPPPVSAARRRTGAVVAGVGAMLFLSAVGAVWSIRKQPELAEFVPDAGVEPQDAGVAELPLPPAPPFVVTSPPDAGVRPPKSPAVKPPPSPTTLVQFFVTPDVSVFLENRPLGHTPMSIALPPGEHVLMLVDKARGINTQKRITVRETAEPMTFRINLALGSVFFRAPEGAEITLNGKLLGRAPIPEQALYEGEHRLQVTHNGMPLERGFVIQAGQRLSVNADPAATDDPELQ